MATSVISLPPTPTSLGAARRWLQDQISDVPPPLRETAALLLSEVVTNSLLHSGSPIEITTRLEPGVLRVEVFDESDELPMRKNYAVDATTGRGLQLVEELSSSWGSERTSGGKFVWFELDLSDPYQQSDTTTEKSETEHREPRTPDGDEELRRFVIRSLPVALLSGAAEQYEGLLREFRFIVESRTSEDHDVPARLLELIDSLNASFSGFSVGQQDEIRQASAQGVPAIDLEYHLPARVGEACRQLDRLLDEADTYCQEGEHLLTTAPAPGAVAFRKWFLGEFVRQSAGAAPVAWPESAWASELAPLEKA